jgi:hypothetical protein
MSRPRLLLIPEFTELSWTIKPQLAEWAEVASYDPPGVGAEPLPEGDVASFTREVIADRGLEELDRLGWDRFFVLADGWAGRRSPPRTSGSGTSFENSTSRSFSPSTRAA